MATVSGPDRRNNRMEHSHNRGPGHRDVPTDFGKAFAVGVLLNSAFVFAEVALGVYSHSTVLLADAGHNLSDVLGLLAGWAAASLAKRAPAGRYTYGLRGSSILAALFNAVVLLVSVGAIGWESILRLLDPRPVSSLTVMIVAAIGIVINGATALAFASGRRSDLNIKGAFLHMASDAAVSLGVVVAAALIFWTGWVWLDPAMSLVICAVILWSTWGLLRSSVDMSLSAAPPGIDLGAVRAFLVASPGVTQIHDLHVWPMSTTETALTCHLVMPSGHPGDGFLQDAAEELADRFHIDHTTIQIEVSEDGMCALASDQAV
jgi:cobalt-zinc-cadmium efflux system protein